MRYEDESGTVPTLEDLLLSEEDRHTNIIPTKGSQCTKRGTYGCNGAAEEDDLTYPGFQENCGGNSSQREACR